MNPSPFTPIFQTVQLVQIGAIPALGDGGSSSFPFFADVDAGDMVLYSGVQGGAGAIRINSAGQWQIFASTGFIGGLNTPPGITGTLGIPLGAGQYLVQGDRLYQIAVPNISRPSATSLLFANVFNPANACYDGSAPTLFADSAKNLLAAEYTQPAGQYDSSIYATIYSGLNHPVAINQGFIGNFPPGADGFNRLNQFLPPYIYNFFGVSSGLLSWQNNAIVFNSIGNVGSSAATVGSTRIEIVNNGVLSCGNPNSQVYIAANATDYNQNMTGFQEPTYFNTGASAIPGVYTFGSTGQSMIAKGNGFVAQFTASPQIGCTHCALLSNGTLLVVAWGLTPNVGFDIYRSVSPIVVAVSPRSKESQFIAVPRKFGRTFWS